MKSMTFFRPLPLLLALGLGLMCSCTTTQKASGPFQSWATQENGRTLDLYISAVAGSPFSHANLGRAAIKIDDQGFVRIQIPIRNHSNSRRIFRVRWEWADAGGMTPGSPTGRTLRQVNIAGGDQAILRSTSSIPNPGVVMLTLHPSN